MADVNKIFGIKANNQSFSSPERQSVEQTEDYAVKKVIHVQELIVNKMILDKASDTYLKFNSTTGELELYVNGSIKMAW